MSDDEGKNLQSVITIAQTLLLKEKETSAITPTLIADKVAVAAALVATGGEVDTAAATGELIRRFSHWIGQDSTLVDDEGHVPWLTAARKRDWRYWQRYQGWLERKMSAAAVDGLDKSTDKILGLLEDPHRDGAWDRRGLVVGHVQSGKTGNYSGLICKAADAGYKIVIVLAGLHNNLRSQTQIRLEEGFLGYETSAAGDAVKLIGVGEIDSDAEIRPNCATNRSNNGDFNTKVAQHYAISPEQRPWLFVVKKNKTVLERLLKWIRNHVADTTDAATGKRFVSNLPLLLIDDEADHASVDTGEQLFNPDGTPDLEHEPKAINSRIRKILHAFAKSAYVGYTATPFANIFIHRRAATSDEGPDLFPQSFIVNLAAPSNYVGPARVFGLWTPDGRSGGLPLIRDVSDHVDGTGTAGWMPPKHNKEHVPLHAGLDQTPPSLREAVAAFVLACAARELRGQGAQHSSMLVHVTRFNLVQQEVRRQVDAIVTRMRQKISRRVDHEAVVAELEALWRNDFEPTSAEVAESVPEPEGLPPMPSWEEILSALPEVLLDIDVKMINGTAKDALDYAEERPKGLKVIAIGGDKLARGLTLEGLCVSYFVRTTNMYDTLMQMGRWFGYRPGYIDLCRLYTTDDLVEWFGHIADASEELREEFDAMAESGATPRDYGLKVQSHPVLLVTSPLKMRSSENLQLSFSGESLETVALHRDPAILKRNLDAADRLIATMGAPSENDPRRTRNGSVQEWKGSRLWSGVPAEAVADFFSAYVTHPKARKVNSALLTEFVRKMAAGGELTSWTVVLLGGGDGGEHVFAGGVKIAKMPTRTPDPDIKDRYSIGRLLSPRDEAIDLDETAWKAALHMAVKARKPGPARQKDDAPPSPPTVPNGPSIRRVRGDGAEGVPPARNRGLLLLYPLDPAVAGVEGSTAPVMAFGASFPTSVSGTVVEYRVDHLLWESEYGPAD
ncbi:Z1 domain-containing protein [Acidiferrobacter thiooxydans]|uniref:Z1 domain-containing protein n=1 Tax=Acidiferrobacter thiooxydans TaxID=163359 RepID=UPI001E46813A|nr:Z1 domain-containing protein [Acidiferrobacter thiooxydans]UEO00374.1 Z1 domain-containing protein [Acidiferrobacter thiooxydans]